MNKATVAEAAVGSPPFYLVEDKIAELRRLNAEVRGQNKHCLRLSA